MYVLGLLKQPFLSPVGAGGKPTVGLEQLDNINFLRFALNQWSPEEILPLLSPQIMSIHDFHLNDQEPPALQSLERSLLASAQLLLCFNGLSVMIYVGKTCDPWFLNEIFKVHDFTQVDRHTGEEEIFAPGYFESSPYLMALYNLINQQMRSQRQPYCELRVLTEGDVDSDTTLKSLLITDAVANPSYSIDFTKFLSTITGASSVGPGMPAGVGAGPGAATAAYY